MKKVIKIITILIMLLGIAFSISNFIIPGKLKASSIRGVWTDLGECEGFGNLCDIGIEEPI